jgi:hypothetical protein
MEGTPDRHRAGRSRETLIGGLGASSTSPTRVPRSKAEAHGHEAAPAKAGEARDARRGATGVSEARSQPAPWEQHAHAHDESREAKLMR